MAELEIPNGALDTGKWLGKVSRRLARAEQTNRVRVACELVRQIASRTTRIREHGFCLVVSEHRIVLGRVRQSAIKDADPTATAESVMEPGPSTVRFNVPASDLVQHLAAKDLRTAIVTTRGGGCLFGVSHRAEAERRLDDRASS